MRERSTLGSWTLDWGSADQGAALSEVALELAHRDGIPRVVVAGETLRG